MQIHRVRGSNLEDALRKARRIHGERALVVSQEKFADGGVALAVAQSASPIPDRTTSPSRLVDAPTVTPREFPKEGEPAKERHAGLRGVAKHLTEHGASKTLVARILGDIDRERLKDHHAIDVAAESIAGMFKIARAPRVPGRTRVMTVLGPPGGGKTSVLIKIAYRLLQANVGVAFASLDVDRLGGNDKLRAWAKRLEIPFHAVTNATRLEIVLGSDSAPEVLLLDTTGAPSIDIPKLRELSEGLASQPMQNFLVLPATDNRSALSKQAAAFDDVELAGAIVTKLDETYAVADTFEHILDEDLAVAFLSDGQNVSENFHRASADGFADLLLTGRLA